MQRLPSLLLLSLALALLFAACDSPVSVAEAAGADLPRATFVGNKEFDEYWYRGEAELSSYILEQARYGEIHQGESVLVFVTEPFSLSKQVKLDDPGETPRDAVSVLKLNRTSKFYTGVYPYSMMQSTFTPVHLEDFPHTLKVSTSSQEWCGHTFTQVNLLPKGYRVQQHSYFESEGDTDQRIPQALLEDELWTRLRINPKDLPTGTVDLVPGTFYSRLRHRPLQVEQAEVQLTTSEAKEEWLTYRVHYPSGQRTLSIHFSKAFPHRIQGWEESYLSGFGPSAKVLTTKATLKKTLQLDYWNHHDVVDGRYREELELNGY